MIILLLAVGGMLLALAMKGTYLLIRDLMYYRKQEE